MNKDLVFIVSGGRTGTTLFGDYFSNFVDDCFSVHEPDLIVANDALKTLRNIRLFGIWHVVIGRLLNKTGSRIIGQKLIQEKISEEIAKEYILKSRTSYFSSIKESLIIESNAQWWPFVKQICEIWPRSKVIIIVRDPRSWVRSWMNKSGRYTKNDIVAMLPPGRLTPRKVREEKWISSWKDFTTFEKLSWEWSFIYNYMDSSLDHEGNKKMFRFEDIFCRESGAFDDLIEYATTHGRRVYPSHDLSDFKATISNASAGSTPSWREWTPNQAATMDAICGPLMRKFGYGDEPEWQALIRSADSNKGAISRRS